MTHYFFHICSRTERIEDREGADFDTLDAALAEARLAAREILAEDLRKGHVDELGELMSRVPYKEAIS